ncbi:NAD-dependent epimerase/dehydratase family protein [uncultured Gimesia sp.]|jgi:2-alkyl-3-oxoalkanoate reductase|uniref:NAD-dependent epimerase/dehydratase family protein n=1 Tax=uncultured Gimesia sp. TaxID=1678688 RepID=UPI0026393C17|nr:NAD-dependent epimerase/dehydratase family protein [uncultured Gimesia sp.]
MNVLVTGGGGFLGLYIVEQLIKAGETVRVLCRGDYPRLKELNVETVQGDIRDVAAVERACEGIDTVYHTAAVSGIWGPWDYFYSINTQGTLNILKACQTQGVTRLIYTSSPSVVYDGAAHENATERLPYSEHFLCHYPHTKMLAEKAVLAANGEKGLATVALRPHLIWGPRDNHLIPRLIQRAKSGRLRQVGDGTNLVSMSYVENAAAAHLQAAARLFHDSPVGGQAYFINEPEPVLLWAWINQLLTAAGLPPVQKQISIKAAKRIGAVLEVLYRVLHLPGEPPMTRFLASQLSSSHYYDISRARHDFGYQPVVDFEEAMRRMQPELKRLSAQQ